MQVVNIMKGSYLWIAINRNSALRSYLESLSLEKQPNPNLFFYSDLSEAELRDLVSSVAEKCWKEEKSGLSPDQAEIFLADEIASLEKFLPQGGHPPISTLMPEIEASFSAGEKDRPMFTHPLWKIAKARVMARYPRPNMRPLSLEQALEYVKTEGTIDSNSGMPLFENRRKMEVQRLAVHDAATGNYVYQPAIALIRTYRGKSRLVWMFPFATNLNEARFAVPLMKALRTQAKAQTERHYTAWKGWRATQLAWTDVYKQGKQGAASDFSHTDSSFGEAVTKEVFDVIAPMFQASYRDELWASLSHMHQISLLIGPNMVVEGSHGVSSGSFWTNLIETIFDDMFGEFVSLWIAVHGITSVPRARDLWKQTDFESPSLSDSIYRVLYALGDDIAWSASNTIEQFSELLEFLAAQAGFTIQAQKTENKRDTVKSLQRRYVKGAFLPDSYILRAGYPYVRAFNSIAHPERDISGRSPRNNLLRTSQICDNCQDNVGFETFCKAVYAGDPGIQEACLDLLENREVSSRELSHLLRELQTSYVKEGFTTQQREKKLKEILSRAIEKGQTVYWGEIRAVYSTSPALQLFLELAEKSR